MFDELEKDLKKRMDMSTQSAKSEISGIRAGRASPSMLDSIKVETYGQKMSMNQIGNITTPDPRTINVEVWDATNIGVVDKALRESSLGINPIIEGNLIRLPLPQLTEERRDEFLKLIGKKGIINVGGPSQTVYQFAKKSNKKIKRIYSKGEFPFRADMSLRKLKKILK